MKLRNKKTGEIKEYTHTMTSYHVPIDGGYEIFTPWKPEEWEELEDVKEPLIKDEKIRKAVRAWAEVNGVKQVIVEKDFSTYTFYPADTDRVSISVWTEPSLSNLSKDKTYTIAELCGEEEE